MMISLLKEADKAKKINKMLSSIDSNQTKSAQWDRHTIHFVCLVFRLEKLKIVD